MENTEETKRQDDQEHSLQDGTPEEYPQSEGEGSAGENPDLEERSTDEIPSQKSTQLAEQLALAEDKYTRLAAEFENFKKRNQTEQASRLKYAQQSLAVDLFGGLDNLELAIGHARQQASAETQELLKGIEMVHKDFIQALAKNNIEAYGEQGEPFDPSLHDAVGTNTSSDIPPDHIALVMRSGYKLFDRVIRPAMVQVSTK